ncbi:hypothetical protein B0A79_24075 [Flavobacterium piscis]|uniref:Uncharacterized protein n=1 Tax=Flavobacterium piscis TaxID=1114874 RepID=A0ABX2XRI6_9FLAO|nr:hypothetical protein [Flavobacterium piscis]OCB73839.1 hypothetical protein FLP_14300 [Flavobacterium piscis]OXE95796.1 hypothetical protein B0A79_24075 [Flavobacterium piscis]
MKKITLLLFIVFSIPAFAQDSDMKIYLEKKETISLEQYDLIKQVNIFYPDIMISKEVKSNYKNNLKVNEFLSSELIYQNTNKFKLYNVTIMDKRHLTYTFLSNDDILTYGDVRIFDGKTVRTLYRLVGANSLMQYFVDGKLINEVKG